MKTSNKVTIIITTFNSSNIIRFCLNKINLTKYNVIIVDNASTDNTVNIIKSNFQEVEVVQNKKNIGYGRGCNVALRIIDTEYCLILNPDAFVFEDDIKKIIDFLDNNIQVALASPLLLNSYPAQKNDILEQLLVVKSNTIKDYNNYVSVKYVIGAIMFLRLSFFKKHGFFDEEIFLYYEDDEICYKTIKNNKECAILTDIYGYHIGHGSSGNSLRILYKRFWHHSFSKFYWKEKQRGKIHAKKSALKLSILFVIQSLIYLCVFNAKKSIEKIASSVGCISYLIGLKAFNKNGNPRG